MDTTHAPIITRIRAACGEHFSEACWSAASSRLSWLPIAPAFSAHRSSTYWRVSCLRAALPAFGCRARSAIRSEEHTSELQSLMRNSSAVFCLKKKKHNNYHLTQNHSPP